MDAGEGSEQVEISAIYSPLSSRKFTRHNKIKRFIALLIKIHRLLGSW